jgi:guanine deaminase
MLLAGQLLLADDERRRCRLAPGFVRIAEQRIVEVVEGEIPTSADAGGPQAMISPGFIDAHLHLPQFDAIGAHGRPLLEWLRDVIFAAEQRWEDTDFARAMTHRVLSDLLSLGTTAVCAFASVHHRSARAALEVARDRGFRGVIGQVLMNREAPAALCRASGQLLEEAARLGEWFPPSGRMAAAISPRFAVSCSEDLLAGAGRLAHEQGAKVQSHLAESVAECQRVSMLFDGCSYVNVYDRAGLLGPQAIFGHGVHLSLAGRSTLSRTGTVIAHCPTANSFLRSGTMDRAALLRDQVSLAIGSDIGAGYERSMVRVARAMIEAAGTIGDAIPSAAEAWYAITAGNAHALRWCDVGRLQAGCSADVLVIEPSTPWLESAADPLSMLMFAWDDRWLKRTMLQGRWVGWGYNG